MTAKEYLSQVNRIKTIIENKRAEREQWIAIATGGGFSDGERVQSSSNGQKMADAVLRKVEIDREIAMYIKTLEQVQAEVLKTIEQLSTREYNILHKIYIQDMDFYEVASIYHKSYSWVYQKHAQALRHVASMMEKGRA